MNRREFLVFAGVGAVAAVVAPKLLLNCQVPPGWTCSRGAGHGGPCAATESVQFTPNRSYQPGDTVHVIGFGNPRYNGTWVVLGDGRSFGRRM